MIDLLGWIGSVCFALCGAPQAVKCAKEKHARGLSTTFLLLWFIGEVCYLVATLLKFGIVFWLLTNYILCLIFVSIIIYYKIKGFNHA